jgi:competence protein ComEC
VSVQAAWGIAAALWIGCLIGGPWWVGLPGLALLAIAAVGTRASTRLVLVAVGVALVGAGGVGGRAELADRSVLAELARTGGAAALHATVVTEPREVDTGAWAIARVAALDGVAIRERAAMRLGAVDGAALGDRLVFTATARPLSREGFDSHLRRLHAVAVLEPVGAIEVVRPAGGTWALTNALRARTREVAWARLPPERAVMLTGLLTGDVQGQSAQQRAQLAAAGLTHLVVVSGRHVGLLLVGVLGAAALLHVGARGRRGVALGALGFYVLLVRWQPSVLRAGVMATLVLGAGLLGRRAEPRHSLAMAVILLLCIDPLLAGHLGFGLSVSATAGVLVLAPHLAARLPGPRPVRLVVAACIGAQVGAAPLLLNLGEGIRYGSVPANLVAVPAAAAAQTIGLLAAGVGVVHAGFGGWIARLAGPFLGVILSAAERAAVTPRLDVATLLSPLALLLLAAVLTRRRAPALAIGALVVAVGFAGLPAVLPPRPITELTVTMLDVGQGDAVLVEVPGPGGGARLLVDGGPDDRAALDELRRLGVRRLDAVVVSHPHHDHTGGLPAVLRSLTVGLLLTGPTPLDPASAALSAGETERVAVQRGVPVHRSSAGERFTLGAAAVRILSPPADGSLGADLNEGSLVLHIATDDGSILLTGDAEILAQQRLLRASHALRADLLKVPHHGSRTSLPAFFDAVGAHTALIGVGADNPYGHPHPDILEQLSDTRILRTDVDGTVEASVSRDGSRVRRRRQRRSVDAVMGRERGRVRHRKGGQAPTVTASSATHRSASTKGRRSAATLASSSSRAPRMRPRCAEHTTSP